MGAKWAVQRVQTVPFGRLFGRLLAFFWGPWGGVCILRPVYTHLPPTPLGSHLGGLFDFMGSKFGYNGSHCALSLSRSCASSLVIAVVVASVAWDSVISRFSHMIESLCWWPGLFAWIGLAALLVDFLTWLSFSPSGLGWLSL